MPHTTMRSIHPLPAARLVLFGVSLFLGLQSHAADAQPPGKGEVVLALADSMPLPHAQAVVLFRAAPSGQHVILLPATSARAESVGGALALLKRLDREHAQDNYSAIIPISGLIATGVPSSRRAEWNSYLRGVKGRPPVSLGDAGRGRWMVLPAGAAERR